MVAAPSFSMKASTSVGGVGGRALARRGGGRPGARRVLALGPQAQAETSLVSSGHAKMERFMAQKGRKCMFRAEQVGSLQLSEGTRSLKDYMSLPPSEYSVLDAEKVQRIGDSTFRCELAQLNFLGVSIQPVLTAEVNVKLDGSGTFIRVVDAELRGAKVAEVASDSFMVLSENDVSWTHTGAEDDPLKEISSKTSVEVHILLPSWFFFSVESTNRTGNFVVKQVVQQVVPRFLQQLKSDYEVWAEGDDSRSAVSSGDLFAVTQSADSQ